KPLFNPDSSTSRDIVLFHRFPEPPLKRGEVVFLKSPTDPNVLLVKRVIALEGDTVQPLPRYPEPLVRVPPFHVWVEGDEPRGRDSNSFGPVSMALIQGRAVGIVWPLSRFGSLPVGADTGDPWSIPSRLAARERSRATRVVRSDA
ncbi:LexA/Signal peptidase, partial [Auricularia subglabra TFB-10046 SS5]